MRYSIVNPVAQFRPQDLDLSGSTPKLLPGGKVRMDYKPSQMMDRLETKYLDNLHVKDVSMDNPYYNDNPYNREFRNNDSYPLHNPHMMGHSRIPEYQVPMERHMGRIHEGKGGQEQVPKPEGLVHQITPADPIPLHYDHVPSMYPKLPSLQEALRSQDHSIHPPTVRKKGKLGRRKNFII